MTKWMMIIGAVMLALGAAAVTPQTQPATAPASQPTTQATGSRLNALAASESLPEEVGRLVDAKGAELEAQGYKGERLRAAMRSWWKEQSDDPSSPVFQAYLRVIQAERAQKEYIARADAFWAKQPAGSREAFKAKTAELQAKGYQGQRLQEALDAWWDGYSASHAAATQPVKR